jgi:hypothetical protein
MLSSFLSVLPIFISPKCFKQDGRKHKEKFTNTISLKLGMSKKFSNVYPSRHSTESEKPQTGRRYRNSHSPQRLCTWQKPLGPPLHPLSPHLPCSIFSLHFPLPQGFSAALQWGLCVNCSQLCDLEKPEPSHPIGAVLVSEGPRLEPRLLSFIHQGDNFYM